MTEIIGVRFKEGGKVYYFDPAKTPVEVGQKVVVETLVGVACWGSHFTNKKPNDF